jgi:hypothetical protein
MNGENSRYGNVRRPVNKIYNPFDPLMDQNIVCYKCNNLGHKPQDWKEMKEDNCMPNVSIPTTTWNLAKTILLKLMLIKFNPRSLKRSSVVLHPMYILIHL